MLKLPFIVLAHGALGPWDEVIFLSVAAVFLIFMGISWVRSRSMEPEYEEEDAVMAGTESSSPAAPSVTPSVPSAERFELK